MAQVSALPLRNPFTRSVSENPLSPSTTAREHAACRLISRRASESLSIASVQVSVTGPQEQQTDENVRPPSATHSLLQLVGRFDLEIEACQTLDDGQLDPNEEIGEVSVSRGALLERPCSVSHPEFQQATVASGTPLRPSGEEVEVFLSKTCHHAVVPDVVIQDENGKPDGGDGARDDAAAKLGGDKDEDVHAPQQDDSVPFRRWMHNLKRRRLDRHQRLVFNTQMSLAQATTPYSPGAQSNASTSYFGHRKSRSGASSFGFVTGVRSASVTVAGTSIMPASRASGQVTRLRSENLLTPHSHARASIDNTTLANSFLDEMALGRAVRRRSILEDLLSSEEGYLKDLKSLDIVSLSSADQPYLHSRPQSGLS